MTTLKSPLESLKISQKELMDIVKEFRDGILEGKDPDCMCYAVCLPLQSYLTMIGVETVLTAGDVDSENKGMWEHYWLTMKDGIIIDPTASQFEGEVNKDPIPDVYIGLKPEWYLTGGLGKRLSELLH